MSRIKSFLLAVMLVCGSLTYAQNENEGNGWTQTTYTFEDGRLDWNEYAEKNKSALIKGNYMLLTCRKENESALSVARLPISPRDNFALAYSMLVPKLDNAHLFGVIFNYQDEDNYNGVFFDNKKFYYISRENGATYTEKKGDVKFKSKKNVPVIVVLAHIGNKLYVNLNNMDIYERTDVKLRHPFCGFYTSGKSSLAAGDIVVKQELQKEDDE
ncbi:MAG: hypothetical protein K2O17_06835 [Bacteroidaceae bacterium]|nr:hypothetical protein [Bacteroidaceae bacterium]